MWWTLGFGESDLTVKYKKGRLNQRADAISRVPTTGGTSLAMDDDIPSFTVEEPENGYDPPDSDEDP